MASCRFTIPCVFVHRNRWRASSNEPWHLAFSSGVISRSSSADSADTALKVEPG